MSLQPRRLPEVPADPARAAFPRSSLAIRIRDELSDDAVPMDAGGPAVSTRLSRVPALLLVAAFASGCVAGPPAPDQSAARATPGVVVRDDLRSVFEQAGVEGSFVLLDVGADQLIVVDRARAERPAVPASTFKVAHSLIALETGAVRGVDEVIPYGGDPQPFPAWERDMSIREAVPASNAAVFQEIARRVGPQREQEWLDRLGYGNRRVGPVVDRFWLDGPLEISPVEQAAFLARLAQRRLPVSVGVQDDVGSGCRWVANCCAGRE